MRPFRPEIVLGPPGTGKTTTLLRMVDEEMSAGTPPDAIGYVSFTKRAANEAIQRACDKFSLTQRQMPYFRTLHSLCFQELGLRRGDVLEGQRLQEFADYAGVRITGRWSDDGTLSGWEVGDRAIFMENLARIQRRSLREAYDSYLDPGVSWHDLDRVSRALAHYKQEHGLLDFSDMLTEFVESGPGVPLQVLFVDEAQDLSAAQWEVVRKLASTCRRVVVAGDDDQAIYAWAGAAVDMFVDLEGEVTVLGQSWRVPRHIQRLADAVISGVSHRRPKEWASREETGDVDYASAFRYVNCDEGEVLVLARNHYVLGHVQDALRGQGIVYEINGRPSISQRYLRAAQTWESLRAGGRVMVADAKAVYEHMSSGVGVRHGFKKLPEMRDDDDVSMQDLRERGGLLRNDIWHEALDRLPKGEVSYMIAARRRGESLRDRPRVRLSTIHSAKGGEADHVVLLTEVTRNSHRAMDVEPDNERRVWYVGVTRARHKLTIVSSRSRLSCRWL